MGQNAAGAALVRRSPAPLRSSARRRLLVASCVGTGGSGCLELQPSTPAPLPTDQLTLVTAELAELTYPGTVGGDCSGDCGAQREAWQANVTAVTSSMGASATRFLYGNSTSTQAILVMASNKAIVAFRGTEDSRDVQINLAANLTQLPLGPRFNGSGTPPPMVHEGFLAAASEVYAQLAAVLRELDPSGGLPVYSVGHSLGGALATLNAAMLQSADSPPNHVAGVYTFGSPRVGDESWAAAYERLGLVPVTLRVVNSRDIVPLVPAPAASGSGFQHIGQLVFIAEANRTFVGPASPLGTCSNDTCGAWDACLANQTSSEATCTSLNTQVQNVCTSQGWLGNLVDAFSNFDEDALGRLVCPLFNNGLNYQPLCCALSTLWSMAKRDVADLLPSWLGGADGSVESPIAFVLVSAGWHREEHRWSKYLGCCKRELWRRQSITVPSRLTAHGRLATLPTHYASLPSAALPLQHQLRASGGRGHCVC
jgi:pimeloyl-ACP methyl ester carboxylesterase